MIKKIREIARQINDNNKSLAKLKLENEQIKKMINENCWANIFNSSKNGSIWFQNVPLNVGRWAANYSLLYILYRILNEVKPQNIMEMGLGETTKMLQAYKLYHNTSSNCVTIEQDQGWIDMRLANGISSENITLIQANVEEVTVHGAASKMYKDLPNKLAALALTFNLIVVDGPVGSEKYSRYNIVELVENNFLADDFIIIIDDFERAGEQQTAEAIKKMLDKKNIEFEVGYYSGTKDQILLCSKKYKYLISL